MIDDLITKLNNQISMIETRTIKEHLDKGDLEEWLYNWRIEVSAISFGLFYERSKNNKPN
jgi:hypothetical protein